MTAFPTTTSTDDRTQAILKLADDLHVQPQVYGDDVFYHLSRQDSGQYYRVGLTEYTFLSLLDGKTRFCEALALTARQAGARALQQQDAQQLCDWLQQQKLASVVDQAESPKPQQASPLQKLNPFWIRIPLGRPDAIVNAVAPLLGWLFHPLLIPVAIVLMLAGAYNLSGHWDRFSASSSSILATDNWLWLLLAWVVLKGLHELGHALTCRRYGGHVGETGIVLAFFAPLAYVDVSSCWSLPNRWQRAHVAVAGMFVEFLVATAAAFWWTETDSVVVQQLLFNVIVMAGISTVLFNANPLMKFDGYYLLSDVLQIPNLQADAKTAVDSLASRFFWGLRSNAPMNSTRSGTLLTYGIASGIWRILICLSMILVGSTLLDGAGIILAVVAGVAWFGMPTWKLITSNIQMWQRQPARAIRGSLLGGCCLTALTAAVLWLPAPFAAVAPGAVMLPDGLRCRAGVEGFIEEIYVNDGQTVAAGTPLMKIRNDEIHVRFINLQHQLKQEQLRNKLATQKHEPGDALVAQHNIVALQDKLNELRSQIEALNVLAPNDGRVVARRLADRLKTFVSEGDELLQIDDGNSREFRISIAQEDFDAAREREQQNVPIRLGLSRVNGATLTRVIPRASRDVFSEALTAAADGPLAVSTSESDSETIKLAQQRFVAIVDLPAKTDAAWALGQTGYVSLGPTNENFAKWLWRSGESWVEKQLAAATAE